MFGGSFNPPHTGHIEIASHIMREFDIERVLFTVACDPPHKEIADGVDAQLRFELTQAALAGHAGFEASDIELNRRGKSYTAETLKALHATYPQHKLYLIVGEDMLENMPTWYEPETVFSLASIIAARRPGCNEEIKRTADAMTARYGARIYVSVFEGPDISSTDVRARVRNAEPISGLVPPGTEKRIYLEGLYQDQTVRAMMDGLRRELKPSRYDHCVGTMRCAIELAARFGFDTKKARIAGLLHDCAKLSDEKLIALAEKYGVEADEYDRALPGLMHDRVGAFYAKEHYGVTDGEICAAIGTHTRCERGMSAFQRMIYLADKIEPTRDYPGVDRLRKTAETDIEQAELECMENVLAHLREKGAAVQPNIYDAMDEIRTIISKKEERH